MVGNENNNTWHCLFDVIDAINSFHFVEKDESTISDILLWAIFANRKELAEICWLKSENHLCELIFFKHEGCPKSQWTHDISIYK